MAFVDGLIGNDEKVAPPIQVPKLEPISYQEG